VFEAVLGLKYEDEEGDLITINSNEDIQMGFESKGMNNAVNLYVTC
jgi:cell division control protein 24